MKTIDKVNFEGKKALIRVDFNVPLNEKSEITDDTRIIGALPTIQKVLKDGGAVVLISHLGRPKNGSEEKFSLKHLINHLSAKLNTTVKFTNDCIGVNVEAAAQNLKPGEVLL